MTELEFIQVMCITVLVFVVNVAIYLLLDRVEAKLEAKKEAEWWKNTPGYDK